MAPGYTHGPWMDALASPRLRDVMSFALPSGDDAALVSLHFESVIWADVAPAAARAHTGEAALAQAVYANGRFTVNVRLLDPNEPPTSTSIDVPLPDPSIPFAQDISGNYAAAAAAAV